MEKNCPKCTDIMAVVTMKTKVRKVIVGRHKLICTFRLGRSAVAAMVAPTAVVAAATVAAAGES